MIESLINTPVMIIFGWQAHFVTLLGSFHLDGVTIVASCNTSNYLENLIVIVKSKSFRQFPDDHYFYTVIY